MPLILSLLSLVLFKCKSCILILSYASQKLLNWEYQLNLSNSSFSTVQVNCHFAQKSFHSWLMLVLSKEKTKKRAKKDVNFIVFSNIIETDNQHFQVANNLEMWYIFTTSKNEAPVQKQNCFLIFPSKSEKGQSVLSDFNCSSAFWTEICFIHPLWNTDYGKKSTLNFCYFNHRSLKSNQLLEFILKFLLSGSQVRYCDSSWMKLKNLMRLCMLQTSV